MTAHRPQHAATSSTNAAQPPAAPSTNEGPPPAAELGSSTPGGPEEWAPMPAASLPTRSGAVGIVGPILAVLLIAAGVALLRDALVGYGLIPGQLWVPAGLRAVDGVAPGTAFLVGGIVAALLGLWLIYIALRRRVRSRATLRSRTGVYLGAGDVARLASAAAGEVGGVMAASSTATRRAVTTTVRTTGGAGVDQAVLDAVHERLDVLDPVPRVRVLVRGPDGRSR